MKYRNNIPASIAMTFLFLCGAFSCTERMDDCYRFSSSHEKQKVAISLNLSVQDLLNPDAPGTKAPKSDTLYSRESVKIENLWVLQFAGTEETDTLLFCTYFDDYEAVKDSAINVISSGRDTNRLYFIANTFDNTIAFSSAKTIAQARKKFMTFNAEDGAVMTKVVGDSTFYYPIMNGYVDTLVGSGIISCSLERSVSRIDCNLKCTVPGLTIQDVTLCNVPNQIPCLTKDYVSSLSIFPPDDDLSVFNYTPTPWSLGVTKSGDSGTKQFTFYVPCNKRGITTNTRQKTKNVSAPLDATYARIIATYIDAANVTRYMCYCFYLGANLVNNFNILPNHKYTYNFTIDNIGNQNTDNRVSTDCEDYRTTDPANCYMVKPAIEGTWKSVRIPIERVYTFWKEYAGKNAESMESSQTPGWVMEVLWSDAPLKIAGESQTRTDVADCNFKWKKASKKYLNGTGEQVRVHTDYFEFEIASSLKKANILVGIRRYKNDACTELDDGFLWSWHIWVSDYDPNKCNPNFIQVDANGNETKFVYKVPDGAVHRYGGALWNNNTGGLKDKFIMDRNLGAYGAGVETFNNQLYYQFGRKDPFSNHTLYCNNYPKENKASTGTQSDNNVNYAVIWPNKYITGTDWTVEALDVDCNPYNATSTCWHDTKQTINKSIFDPCPSGWRIPYSVNTWGSVSLSNSIWADPIGKGLNYFPTGSRSVGPIYLPASGRILHDSGVLNGEGSRGYHWACKAASTYQGIYSYIHSAGQGTMNGPKGRGFTIRCIQE